MYLAPMTKHTVLYRNTSAGLRVEERGSSASIIMESGSAGTAVRVQDVSADEMITIGKRLIEIGRGMPTYSPLGRGDEPKVALTAEDLAFNLATKDCEAWCKVNLDEEHLGDKARKKAVDGDGTRLFQEFYRDALSPLLADIRKDSELTGYYHADGSAIKADAGEGIAFPPLSGQLKAILEKRDAPLILPRKSKKKVKTVSSSEPGPVVPSAPVVSESER